MQGEPQYDSLPEANITITLDTISIIDPVTKKRIDQPVVTNKCQQHPRSCLSFNVAQKQFEITRYIVCTCGIVVNHLQDLRKDFRQKAYKEFHPLTETIQILFGLLTHKSNRKKRYNDAIMNANNIIPNFIQGLVNRFHQQNSVSSILQSQSGSLGTVPFWAYCLLDKVKLTMPVRIIKCSHPECYELTSLLVYRQQILNQPQSPNPNGTPLQSLQKFKCQHYGCQQELDISDLPNMIAGLVMDLDLLRVLNKGFPSQFKFTYNPSQKRFEDEMLLTNGTWVDPFIKKIHPQEQDFQEFQQSVQEIVLQVMQGEVPENIQILLKQELFKTKQIDMRDPFSKEIIEFPVRCIYCKDFSKCADVRSFAADYKKYQKNKGGVGVGYKCILCNNENKKPLLSSFIYFDQNLLSKMFKDMNYVQVKSFKYDGRQYLLDVFYNTQKLSREAYLNELKEKSYGSVGKFSIQKCSLNPKKDIEIPLLLRNCPSQSYIDFDSFYNKMVELNFDKTKEVSFCKCTFCNSNPITDYTQTIFYHEAFGEALDQFRKSKVKCISFTYDFVSKKIEAQKKKDEGTLDQSIVINQVQYLQNGFYDLMDDEEYQQIFKPQLLDGKVCQILGMSYEIFDNVHVEYNTQGVKANLEEKVKDLNKNVSDEMKKYHCVFLGMKLEQKNDDIKANVGTLYSSGYIQNP